MPTAAAPALRPFGGACRTRLTPQCPDAQQHQGDAGPLADLALKHLRFHVAVSYLSYQPLPIS